MSEEPEQKEQQEEANSEFNIESLFIKGRLYKEYEIYPGFKVKFRTLTADESLEVRNDPAIETGTASYAVGLVGMNSAAQAIAEMKGSKFEGTLAERREKLKKLPSPILEEIMNKHAKFYREVQNLFPKELDKLSEEIEKK